MMNYMLGRVKIYQRNIKRKLKDGTNKTYKTVQSQVILEKNDIFQDNQKVNVVDKKELEDFIKLFESYKKDHESHEDLLNLYKTLQIQKDNLENEINKLRNKHDHLQERLRAALEEINQHQKVINDLSNRGFLDYITGRLPESYKLLSGPDEK